MHKNIGFNSEHPELKSGEMFVTNTANNLMTNIGWHTKRLGRVAYDVYGDPIQGLYPVFKSKDEVLFQGL
tara:strand:+ start:271 stop:480 length:210 start_codon:yes stop_codon:yes gene_type:complete